MGRPPLDWKELFHEAEYNVIDGESYLAWLYTNDKLSLRQIGAKLKVDPYTVRRKLLDLGITLRPRGGPNNVRNLSIPEDELRSIPMRALAAKYKTSTKTICRMRNLL